MKGNKNHINYIIAYLIVFFVFDIYPDFLFFITPAASYTVRDVFIALSFLEVIRLFLLRKITIKSKTDQAFFLFVAAQCLFFPVYSALMAYINYKQPMLYGILAERGRFICLPIIIIYHYLSKGKFSLSDFNQVFLTSAWICLFSYLFIRFLYEIQPGIFKIDDKSAEIGGGMFNANASETKGATVMRVSLILFVYAIIFYFIQFFERRKIKSLVKVMAFGLFIIVFNRGRGIIIFIFITLFIYYWNNSKVSNKISFIIFIVLLLSVYAADLINITGNSNSFFNSYIEIFTTVQSVNVSDAAENSSGVDPSTWARISDFAVISDAFSKSALNWLFGLGRLSNQYNGGTANIINKYFYPEDVGIPGAVFLYGIIVVLVFKTVYININRKLKSLQRQDVYIKTIKYFIVFIFISSVQTGSDIMGSPEVLTCFYCFSLIYFQYKINTPIASLKLNLI